MKKKANSQKKSCSDITWKRLDPALKDIKGWIFFKKKLLAVLSETIHLWPGNFVQGHFTTITHKTIFKWKKEPPMAKSREHACLDKNKTTFMKVS